MQVKQVITIFFNKAKRLDPHIFSTLQRRVFPEINLKRLDLYSSEKERNLESIKIP